MPNGIKISISTFEDLKSTDAKLSALFEALVSYTETMERRLESGSKRFDKLENRKLIDKVYATIGGVIGGILATFGIKYGS